MTKKKLYKFTDEGGETYGGYRWPLPTKKGGKWIPGEWTTPVQDELIPCKNGYHLTDFNHVFDWANVEMYEVEYKGKLVASENGDKFVVRSARLTKRVETWNDKTLRLFAVWCARNALALFDNPHHHSVTAVDVAERYANGKATDEELAAAMNAASYAAYVASDAAYAARAAARAAAWDAARDAAWHAAWDAARATASDAAWHAARKDQLKKLKSMLKI